MQGRDKLALRDFCSKVKKLKDASTPTPSTARPRYRLRPPKTSNSQKRFTDNSNRLLVHDFMEKHKPKVPNPQEVWNNSRDVSHIKDKLTPKSYESLNFPTDINDLSQIYNYPDLNKNSPRDDLNDISVMFSTSPSSRQDVENLTKWLILMQNKYDSKEDLEGYFKNSFILSLIHI